MFAKTDLKTEAVGLRKRGFSYSEILEKIPVAKSTLSLWLRDVGLAKAQKQRITEKRRQCSLKGALARKERRIALCEDIYEKAEKEIGKISKRELWLIGVALYWAEGSKEKEHHPGNPAEFCNSDPLMIKLFLRWLCECCEAKREDISFQLYLHESHKHRLDEVIKYWSKFTEFPVDHFTKIYYKKNKIGTQRKNTGDLYFGLLRVNIRRSSGLLRRIKGWTNGIIKNCGVV